MGYKDYGGKFEDLRQKAEQALKNGKDHSNKLALEMDELIHELEVHQIELEMQNEDLIRTQIQLEDSRRDYLELYDFAPVGYFTLDENGIIKIVNLTGTDFLGKPRKFLLNSAFVRYVAPDYRKKLHRHFHQVMKTQLKKQCDIELISHDKTHLFVSLDTMPVFDEEGTFKEFRVIVTDNSERKKAEEALKESEARLAGAQKVAKLGNWEWDLITNKVSFSDEMYQIFGVTPKEHNDDFYSFLKKFIHPDDRDAAKKSLETFLKEKKPVKWDYRIILPDNSERIIHGEARTAFDDGGNLNKVFGTIQDITERKKIEEELQTSLEEKEMLLREIHHRVKNNLIVISSLLSLQADYIKDKTSREMFLESQSRAKSMALIHERLYQSTDLKRIDFGDYIRTLCMDLYRTYVSNPEQIKLHLNLKPVPVDINTAIPCGLIINELVSNTMKHAFPEDKMGDINIEFHSKDKNLILSVQDNGVGFPQDIDFKNTESLGLSIVNSLVGQIDGEIEMVVNGGTKFTITFPEVTLDS